MRMEQMRIPCNKMSCGEIREGRVVVRSPIESSTCDANIAR